MTICDSGIIVRRHAGINLLPSFRALIPGGLPKKQDLQQKRELVIDGEAVVGRVRGVRLAIRFALINLDQHAAATSATMAARVNALAVAWILKPAGLASPDKSYQAAGMGGIAVIHTDCKTRCVHLVHELVEGCSMVGGFMEHLKLPLVDHLMCDCFAKGCVWEQRGGGEVLE